MSKDIILKVENISKQYQVRPSRYRTLSHDLVGGIQYEKENPYLKIGDTNDRAQGESDYVSITRY
jgi:lipopolysaccharide transport system ATP-binding protein